MSAINTKITEFGSPGPVGKNKQWQRELLMERLRTHSSQNKTFPELSKAMRMSMLEKRYSLDAAERSNWQKCLDGMQHCIKVTTRQGLIERLESLSRQLGLKFMEDTSILFISSDMFYLEIVLDATGTLSDVKVHHECKINQPQSCSELVTCLLQGDFVDFTVQLEGLSSIYQLDVEPKVKSKAFVALEAMESDLHSLYAAQKFHKDTQITLLESSVGLVQKRRGGHPMRLTYFVSPYDLLNLETKSLMPLSIDIVSNQRVGMSVTVNLEASNPNQLQILPTVTINSDAQNGSVPVFAPITPANSIVLPATFVLRLNKPLPICDSLMEMIKAATQQDFSQQDTPSSIMELVVQAASNREMTNGSKGLFLTLPDQNHCYFFTENTLLKGSIIKCIPYTEPSHVPKILTLLRQQALFHTLLSSCVRPESKMGDLENTTMLEVSAISIHQISVALQHPSEESMATVEFDLKDASNIDCRIYTLTNNYDAVAVKLTKIIQNTLSIPITVRALLKFWDQEQMKSFNRGGNDIDSGNFNLPLTLNDPGGRIRDFRDIKPIERNMNGNFGSSNRQFSHASAVLMGGPSDSFMDCGVNIFDGSHHKNVMMNSSALKAANDGSFIDTKENIGGEDFYESPKSKTDITMNQMTSETSDSSSLGTSPSTSDFGVASNHNLKRKPNVDSDNSSPFVDSELSRNSLTDNISEPTQKISTNIDRTAPDEWRFKNNSCVDSKVSILAVKPSGLELNSVLSGMGLERRPGIEIIPITAAPTQSLPTSITITPITSSSKREKKSGSSRKFDEKSRSEKKRKRRKEDSYSMGPPDKMLTKQDILHRGVNVSMKGTEVSSELFKNITSSGLKFTSNSLGRRSPKHSPSHISPKHMYSSTHSPKSSHNMSSPKHSSLGGSGKPSMSTLKSATNSSPKSEKINSKVTPREKDREKERSSNSKSSSLGSVNSDEGNSPKLKTSTVKLKQIDLSAALLPSTDHFPFEKSIESDFPAASGSIGTSSGLGNFVVSSSGMSSIVQKMRKNSLSAVIDKLKSAQHSGNDIIFNTGQLLPEATNARDRLAVGGNRTLFNSTINYTLKLSSGGSSSMSSVQQNSPNSEYMIRPSLDGMKITINKTRNKSSSPSSALSNSFFSKIFSSSGGGSGSDSPKRHTGLKPGVNSGPASKKSQSNTSLLKSSNSSQSHTSLQGRGNFQKSNSSGSLSYSSSKTSFQYTSGKSLSSSSLSSSPEVSKKDKAKNRSDASDVMKMLGFASPMDGFMRSLNTKFQIPKLSARTNDDSKKSDMNKIRVSNASPATTVATTNSVTTTDTSATQSSISPTKPVTENPAVATQESSQSVSDNLSREVHSKYPFSLSALNVVDPLSNSSNAILNTVSNYYPGNPNPSKQVQEFQNRNTKSPLNFNPAENEIPPKEIQVKSIASTVPVSTSATTQIDLISQSYNSAIGLLGKASTYRTVPSSTVETPISTASLLVNQQINENFMRPLSAPSAAGVIDMSRTTLAEVDLSLKVDGNISSQTKASQPRSLSTEKPCLLPDSQSTILPSAVRKMNNTSLMAQHKHNFPASPSVSVHIVKSPAPSPLMVLPSPHSSSPCITDDELMDDALVGIGK